MRAAASYPPANIDERWRYAYDYLGRRVEKHHEKYVSGSWVTQSRTRYVYDGWNLIEELKVPTSGDPTVSRQYTWGLDLSGLNGDSTVSGLHGAGGIGGLLAVYDTNNTTTTSDDRSFVYCYDANGNVGQLVEWASGVGSSSGMAWATGRMVAKYEYDPYGNTVSKSGSYADMNPFRFSTKFFDAETGLYYYGYRYYSPRLGRWISRDPIGELGGVMLYGFLDAYTTGAVDLLGEMSLVPDCVLEWVIEVSGGPGTFLAATGGSGYTYLDCVGDCIGELTPLIAGAGAIAPAGNIPTRWRPAVLGGKPGSPTRLITAIAAKCGGSQTGRFAQAIKATRGISGGIKLSVIGAGATAAAIEAICAALCTELTAGSSTSSCAPATPFPPDPPRPSGAPLRPIF